MTMPVRVPSATAMRGVTPGTLVDFQLDRGTARNLKIRRAANEIEQDGRTIALAPPKEMVHPGDSMPDFELTNQRGGRTRLSSYKGSVVAIQFLYTRCPMPEVCPRLAATFARMQRRFSGRDLILMSVTLDPVYDTPAMLSRYANLWRAQMGWHFLTGSDEEIKAVAKWMGLIYWPEEGVITHNSTIGIIGRNGRVAAMVEGLSFDAQQLGDLIATELDKERQ